jgi:hypothetical protein
LKTILKYGPLALALALTVALNARALDHGHHPDPRDSRTAPEVDPSLAISGLALLGGALSVALARRSKG